MCLHGGSGGVAGGLRAAFRGGGDASFAIEMAGHGNRAEVRGFEQPVGFEAFVR